MRWSTRQSGHLTWADAAEYDRREDVEPAGLDARREGVPLAHKISDDVEAGHGAGAKPAHEVDRTSRSRRGADAVLGALFPQILLHLAG
jgi:hypothetical protein